jgi:hypothetical protein
MTGLLTRRARWFWAILIVAGVAAPVSACPFCGASGQTLTQELNQAAFVIYGKVQPANPGDGGVGGTTDLILDPKNGIIKDHEFLKGKKVVTIPKFIPADKTGDVRWLLYCDVFKGKIDPYRGVPVKASADMPRYLKGARAVQNKPMSERLRFFFPYLHNADTEIAIDALKEFGNTDYQHVRAVATDLPAKEIARWLKKPTQGYEPVGLFALILGHAKENKGEYAKLLRSLLDDPEHPLSTGLDGVLVGQLMLQPKEGYEYLRSIFANAKKDFPMRYAALRAARFFVDSNKDVISKQKCVDAVKPLLDQKDIADLAIEDLRRWETWELTKPILALKDRDGFDIPVMKRAILRFMLCSTAPEAKKYVAEARKEDAQSVEDMEELLKIEKQTAKSK